MRMLWNTDTTSTCVLHPFFRIHSPLTLFLNLALTFLLALAYERSRLYAATYDRQLRAQLVQRKRRNSSPPVPTDGDALLGGGARVAVEGSTRMMRSGLYTANVALSFILMLIVRSLLSRWSFSIEQERRS